MSTVGTCDILAKKEQNSVSHSDQLPLQDEVGETNTGKKSKSIFFISQEKWFCTREAGSWGYTEMQDQCSMTF